MADLKNVVIIGASVAGHDMANRLAKTLPSSHRVLLIDARAFAFWPLASLRASVKAGWEDAITHPLTTDVVFKRGTSHQVIAANPVKSLGENKIILEHAFEGSTTVPFDKCVIATGATQPPPMRPRLGASEDEFKAWCRENQAQIARAEKVVIIGAGPVGVEMAGEIRDVHPHKQITLVTAGPHVLNAAADPPQMTKHDPFAWSDPPLPLSVSIKAEHILTARNINLIRNERVVFPSDQKNESLSAWNGQTGLQKGMVHLSLESGKSIEADFVFTAIGNKPNSDLARQADKGAIAKGFIAVDEYFRVISKTAQSPLTKSYYAVGDCCSSPGSKTLLRSNFQVPHAAANVVAAIRGRQQKPYYQSTFADIILPIGIYHGTGFMTFPYLGTFMLPAWLIRVGKGKALLTGMFYSRFQGSTKVAHAKVKE